MKYAVSMRLRRWQGELGYWNENENALGIHEKNVVVGWHLHRLGRSLAVQYPHDVGIREEAGLVPQARASVECYLVWEV